MKPGYKQTEIGVIPIDWENRIIGELFDFKNGLNKSKEFFGCGTPIVNYMDVFENTGLYKKDIRGKVVVSKKELKAYSVKKGDVFFTRTSETVEEIGITSVMLESIENTVFSGFILRARPKSDVLDLHFRKYCFRSKAIRVQITSRSTYTTRALTNGTVLSQVMVPCPIDKTEQWTIATALSDVDALIAALYKLIAKKCAIKTATMQQLLTGKKRLPGFGDGKGYKQTEIGIIPGDWDVRQLSTALKETPKYGINASSVIYKNNLPMYIRITDISQNGYYSPIELVAVDHEKSDQFYLEEGDLVFARTGASVGKSYLYNPTDGKLVFAGFLIRIRPNDGILLPSFFAQYVKTKKYWDWVQLMSMRSGQPGINGKEYGRLLLPFPKLSEQRAISTVLTDMDAEITALEARCDKTKAIKQGMMQELLTGRTRLI